jgi:hypothetical protein
MTMYKSAPDYDAPANTVPSSRPDVEMNSNYTRPYAGETKMGRNGPAFEGRDIVAASLAATMMLGPLLAYAVGWGSS